MDKLRVKEFKKVKERLSKLSDEIFYDKYKSMIKETYFYDLTQHWITSSQSLISYGHLFPGLSHTGETKRDAEERLITSLIVDGLHMNDIFKYNE